MNDMEHAANREHLQLMRQTLEGHQLQRIELVHPASTPGESYFRFHFEGSGYIRMSKGRPALCEFCRKKPHTKLCYGPRGMTSTCDAKICDDCATHTEPDHDFCPNCAGRIERIQRGLFESQP